MRRYDNRPPSQREILKGIFEEASEKFDLDIEYIKDIWDSIWRYTSFLGSKTNIFPVILLHYFGTLRVPFNKMWNHMRKVRMYELSDLDMGPWIGRQKAIYWPLLKRLSLENKRKRHANFSERVRSSNDLRLFDSFITKEQIRRLEKNYRGYDRSDRRDADSIE